MRKIDIQIPGMEDWTSIEVPDEWSKDQIISHVDTAIANYRRDVQAEQEARKPENMYANSYKLARDKSAWDSAMIAAGREFDALTTGARMLWNKATGDTDEYNKLVAENNEKNKLMQPLRDEHGVATFAGSMLPYLAASPSIAGGVAKIPTALTPNIVKQGIAGGAKEIVSWLPQGLQNVGSGIKVGDALMQQGINRAYMTDLGRAAINIFKDPVKQGAALGGTIGAIHADDTALTGALGGAVGAALGKTLGKPFTKRTNYLTDSQKAVVQEAKDMGYYLLPGQRTGDLVLGQMDQRLAANPGVGKIFRERALQNNAVVSNQIAKDLKMPEVAGWNADALYNGYNHIGSVMDKVAERSNVKFDKKDVMKLYDIVNEYSRFPGTSDLAKQWQTFLWREFGVESSKKGGKIKYPNKIKIDDKKWNFKGGEINGELYQQINTRLNQQIASALKDPQGDRALGQTLLSIKELLSEGLEKGTQNKADVELLNWARGAYRKLNIVRDSVDANSGIVDLKALYKNFTKGNSPSKYDQLIKKDNLFSKLARIGKLEQETKAKVDLATAGIAKGILGESPTKMRGFYKYAMAGLGDMDYHTILPRTRVNLYLNQSGWPAATGAIPLLGKGNYDRLQKIFSRATLGDMTPEEQDQIPYFNPDKASGYSLWE